MDYKSLFRKLWDDYCTINPSIDKIHKLLSGRGETVVNDHIAFRTFDLPGINIDSLSKNFIEIGYTEKGQYNFVEKKLNARHFEHSEDKFAPKVFISELRTNEFSLIVKEVASWIADEIKRLRLDGLSLLRSKRKWSPIKYATYELLRKESEYAAWLYVHGFRANHFTVFVNFLNTVSSIEEMNILLKKNNFNLNTSGGEIKGSTETYLKQSSTLADKIYIQFEEGSYEIPCCYYEFAERFKDETGNLFSGFVSKSADKIFESTNKK
jgi:hypothetical protein